MNNYSSFDGAQAKWTSEGIWYKRDLRGGEAVAETLVSLFLESCLNVTDFRAGNYGYVPYRVSPNDKRVCLSPNFLENGKTFVSLYEAMKLLKPRWSEHTDFEGKLEYIDSVYRGVLGYSCKNWLLMVLTLDVMFRNTDRHLSNLGFVSDRCGGLQVAPIFDNGMALGVSEGAYFDLANTISGLGFRIKPYELTVRYLEKYINPNYFAFSVDKFIKCFDKNIPKTNLLLAFLNILVRYYPKDSLGVDTKKKLEEYFGPFSSKRFI